MSRSLRRARLLAAAAAVWTSAAVAARADTFQVAQADLNALSIEELANVEVLTVARRPQTLSQAPGAVFVISGDDLRRAGAQSLPEALRLAPNLEVARIDALDYSITARGFGGFESANKLLVQIDGRSVYTPVYSGVDWDQHQVFLDDVEQIEVVSGPGGALWGANAVNGVVSVRSRSAEQTQGLLVGASAGTLDSDLRIRYGGRLGDHGGFRVYAMGFLRGDLERATGANANDGWSGAQIGFRADWGGGADRFTFQGDYHDGDIDNSIALPGYLRGGNVLGRWTRGGLEVQAYYDRVERSARLVFDQLETADVSLQHTMDPMGRHQLVWGGGFRQTRDDFRLFDGTRVLDPGRRSVSIGNLFVQDQIAVTADIDLTLGLKVEDNSYTQLELMPSARVSWRVDERNMLWAAVSRAIRNPSRIERDYAIPGLVVPHRMGAEELIAYEAGYRGRPSENSTLSVSLFYNDYQDLRTNELTRPGVLPIYVGNGMRGVSYGAEIWGELDVTSWWRLSAGAVLLHKDFELKPGSLDLSRFEAAGMDPDHWIKLRSQFRLRDNLDLDVRLRGFGDIPRSSASGYLGAASFVEADVRLAWRPRDDVELALAGMNLLNERHAEASESRRSEIPRSALVSLRWTY